MKEIVKEVVAERKRQKSLVFEGQTAEEFDKLNTQSDWVAYIAAYVGRATQKVSRNVRENQSFRENMIKVAALAIAAVESHDKNYC